jgi:hypothetical protein
MGHMDRRMVVLASLLAFGCSSKAGPETPLPPLPDAGASGPGPDSGFTWFRDSGSSTDTSQRTISEPHFEYNVRLVPIGEDYEIRCEDARAGNVVVETVHRETGKVDIGGFACIVPTRSEDLAPGTYDLTFTLHNRSKEPISTVKGTYVIGPRSGVEIDLFFPIQTFKVTYAIGRDGPGGRTPVTCQETGAQFVFFSTLLAGDPVGNRYTLGCEGGPVLITPAVSPGSYTYEVGLMDGASRVIATTGRKQLIVTVEKRAELQVDLTVP